MGAASQTVEKVVFKKSCTKSEKSVCPLEAGMGSLREILRPAGRAF